MPIFLRYVICERFRKENFAINFRPLLQCLMSQLSVFLVVDCYQIVDFFETATNCSFYTST